MGIVCLHSLLYVFVKRCVQLIAMLNEYLKEKKTLKAHNVYHHCNVLNMVILCTIFVTKPIGLQ